MGLISYTGELIMNGSHIPATFKTGVKGRKLQQQLARSLCLSFWLIASSMHDYATHFLMSLGIVSIIYYYSIII